MSTIRDVAREAGVSVATVSRVFNDSAQVSAGTRRAVREVADRLNYWPNAVARSLITARTHSIGVLLPELHGEFFSEVIRGIDLTARRAGFHLLISSSHSEMSALMSVVLSLRGRIDGLIVMAPDQDAPANLQACAGSMPVVLINPGTSIDGCDTVSLANFDGAYAMTQHLLALGHRRIAIVRGPDRNMDARHRTDGYRAALADEGLGDASLEFAGDFREASGAEAGRQILDMTERPTAVFAANDYMAVGLLSVFRDAGVRVPADIAVTGFDDIAIARYIEPALTTVHIDAYSLGERAVEQLLSLARERRSASNTHHLLPASVVVRTSCGGAGRATHEPAARFRPVRRARARAGTEGGPAVEHSK